MAAPPRLLAALVAGALLVGTLVAGALALVSADQPQPPPEDRGATPCGPPARKADGSRWTCTFSDEFTGDQLDGRKWTPLRTRLSGVRTAGNVCFVSTPDTIAVREGTLRLTAQRHPPFLCPSPQGRFRTTHTSASVSTTHRFSQAYGRFAARIRFAAAGTPGLHGTFWLFPQAQRYGGWPESGEIDIAEALSVYPDRVFPSAHYRPGDLRTERTGWTCRVADPTDFHEYALEWSPRELVFSYDGQPCFRHRWVPAPPLRTPQPFDQPFFIALNQAIGYGPNAPTPTAPLPGTLEVDWVRAWR